MARRSDLTDVADGGALRRAKALGSPTRRTMLELLEAADGPLTAQELAALLGVHHTAVRQHAAVLAEAGLLRIEQLPPDGRGRPKVAYRSAGERDPYLRLASLLAEAASAGISPREAGRRHGLQVSRVGDDPVTALAVETEHLGFRPLVHEDGGQVELVLQACPFAVVAAASPEVVCDLHHGIAEGVAQHIGGLEVVGLRVGDPHAAGCRLIARRVT